MSNQPRDVLYQPVLRIRNVYAGSKFFSSQIRFFFHPGSKFSKKMFLSSRKYDPGCSSRIRILIFYPSRIQGSKRHRIPDPDPQHCYQHRSTAVLTQMNLTRTGFGKSPRIRTRKRTGNPGRGHPHGTLLPSRQRAHGTLLPSGP